MQSTQFFVEVNQTCGYTGKTPVAFIGIICGINGGCDCGEKRLKSTVRLAFHGEIIKRLFSFGYLVFGFFFDGHFTGARADVLPQLYQFAPDG